LSYGHFKTNNILYVIEKISGAQPCADTRRIFGINQKSDLQKARNRAGIVKNFPAEPLDFS
jgi:hypothetical protein